MCICEHQVGTICVCVFFFRVCTRIVLFINYFRCVDPATPRDTCCAHDFSFRLSGFESKISFRLQWTKEHE